MYIKLMEHVKKKNDLANDQLGIVVYNNDPLKKGRVKVVIQELLTDTFNNCEKLPWVYPSRDFGITGGKGTVIDPPQMNARLRIKFLSNDINFPTYTGYWSDDSNYLSSDELEGFYEEFKLDYPNVYGFQDSEKNYELTNNLKGIKERGFFDKVKEVIDKNGNYLLDEVENGLINANKFEIDSSEINLGNLENTMKLLKENHLDNFSNLLKVLNTIFTFLPVIDAISEGEYTTTILPQWITAYTNILATMNDAKTQELNGS